jgi:hypothetical protein
LIFKFDIQQSVFLVLQFNTEVLCIATINVLPVLKLERKDKMEQNLLIQFVSFRTKK